MTPINSNEIINDLRSLERIKRRRIWEPFMKKYNCEVICEIGVRQGINFRNMIQHNPKVAIAVDAWINDGVMSKNDEGASQEYLDIQYADFKNSVADKSFIQIYREYSVEAVKRFDDNYFDLIYIDADHTYSACLQDIENWYPKVKSGRFLLGDDYRVGETKTGVRFGVRQAVADFTKKNNLEFFQIGHMGWGIIKP